MPVTSETERVRRPRRLVLAGVLCIVVGWGGVLAGYRELSFYSADAIDDPPLMAGVDASRQEAIQVFSRIERRAHEQARRTQLPLATANLLLSGLLVFAATRAFGQRPGSRPLALQAVAANAALAVGTYVASRDLRGQLVPAMADALRAGMTTPAGVDEAAVQQAMISLLWAGMRAQLAALLLVYAVSFWGLQRAEA